MAPKTKHTKEQILLKAMIIVIENGFEALNARALAKKIGCSVQPIFSNFMSIDDLKKQVMDAIELKFCEYILDVDLNNAAYFNVGLRYIKFAKDYPQYFHIIFMTNRSIPLQSLLMSMYVETNIYQIGMEYTGFNMEQQKDFHNKVWMFTHGIACLIATKTVVFSESEIETVLRDGVLAMKMGYIEEIEGERE